MQSEQEFRSAVATLVGSDPVLAAMIREFGMPDFWYRPPGFATLVLFILEQQVSLASGAAAFRKLQNRIGAVTPEAVLVPNDEELRADGFSRQKTRYVRELARSVLEGKIDLAALAHEDDDEVRKRLLGLVGIGPWTADVYLLSCLRRPDTWPVLDRALQVAAAEACALAEVPDPPALEALGERWRPHRSTAARLLWHSYLSRRGRAEVTFVEL
ncbi:MAG TPA: DNA-3-methyladenine glycosylase 2 family protein [Acidimicrobiia bacterium]|nr:DNA-3-methyladenine glycosylase 2 family protein [Acidimicrobiia bacterium]